MGLWDVIRGHRPPPPSNLDALFAMSTAAMTLQVNLGLEPTGQAAVCFKPVDNPAFDRLSQQIRDLVGTGADPVEIRQEDDALGYRWLIVSSGLVEAAVVAVHAVNATLRDAGFAEQLTCTVFAFHDEEGPAYFVYVYKRGTFYPFAPRDGRTRDDTRELRLSAALEGELPIEPDHARWYPLWDLPLG